MSTVYNANGTLPAVTKFAPVAIVSSTLATPIVVTLDPAGHGFSDGDTVRISGHDQRAANGLWQITWVSLTKVSLNGSVGAVGAGTATGIATDLSINPLITIPSSGDGATAASVNPALEGTFNLAPFLFERAGTYRVFNRYLLATSDDTWAAWSTNASLASGAWGTVASGTGLVGFPAATGDLIDISFACTGTTGGGASPVPLGLGASFEAGAYGIIAGSAQRLQTAVANQCITLRGLYTVPQSSGVNITGSAINLGIMAYGNGGAPPSLNLIGHRTLIATHYRSNA